MVMEMIKFGYFSVLLFTNENLSLTPNVSFLPLSWYVENDLEFSDSVWCEFYSEKTAIWVMLYLGYILPSSAQVLALASLSYP
jgi:hypothetical protein